MTRLHLMGAVLGCPVLSDQARRTRAFNHVLGNTAAAMLSTMFPASVCWIDAASKASRNRVLPHRHTTRGRDLSAVVMQAL